MPSGSKKTVVCCRCDRSSICRNCSCVKAGQPCVRCTPGNVGKCLNQQACSASASVSSQTAPSCLPSGAALFFSISTTVPATIPNLGAGSSSFSQSSPYTPPPPTVHNFFWASSKSSDLLSKLPSEEACPNTCQSSLQNRYSFFSLFPHIHHVPKGASYTWARLVFDTFSAINEDFSNPDPWCRFFMLLGVFYQTRRMGTVYTRTSY